MPEGPHAVIQTGNYKQHSQQNLISSPARGCGGLWGYAEDSNTTLGSDDYMDDYDYRKNQAKGASADTLKVTV